MQTILLIEDHAIFRENLATVLSLEGYQVVEAEDGGLGVQHATEEPPSLIVCDFDLPVLDGFDVFTLLRHNQKTRNIPIVLLTGSVNNNVRFRAMQEGVEAYLPKPCSIAKILTEIERCLSLSSYRIGSNNAFQLREFDAKSS